MQTKLKKGKRMNTTLKLLKALSVLSVVILVAWGCQLQETVAPDMTQQNIVKGLDKINVLSFGVENRSLKKITEASKWMTVEEGGYLQLFHMGDDTTDVMFVYSSIYVEPNTMSADAEVGLKVDDQNFAGNVDIEFAPHGLKFTSPAKLTMYAYGLDLSDVDTSGLNIYYINEDTGEWEEMYCEMEPYFDVEQGIIFFYNAHLPHFSRYAIGTE